jgi:hypothetical protein
MHDLIDLSSGMRVISWKDIETYDDDDDEGFLKQGSNKMTMPLLRRRRRRGWEHITVVHPRVKNRDMGTTMTTMRT